MIKEIKVENFLSFKNEVISLDKNQNILVGINGSGKSNFIKLLRLLKEGVAGMGLGKHLLEKLGGYDNVFFKGGSTSKNETHIKIEYTLDADILKEYGFNFTDDVIYSIEIWKQPSVANYYIKENIKNTTNYLYLDFNNGSGVLNEKTQVNSNSNKTGLVRYQNFIEPTELALSRVFDTNRYFALSTIRKAISDIMVYDYFDTTASSTIRKAMLPTSEKRLVADGSNLPQILNTIKINHKASYNKIVQMLNNVNPKFRGFDFNLIGGNIELMLDEEGLNSAIHVSSISDGTLRYLCLLSILYNPDRGRLICIDEPEIGLHPDMISSIGGSIIEASENSALIIATHSENLLNSFEIKNIRVFEKDEYNSTTMTNYTEDSFKGWYDDFIGTGKMWRNGDFGGNRW